MIPSLAALGTTEWSLIGVVALIAIVCAVIALLRGAVRLTWWSLRLAMAVIVGYWIWWYSVDWLLLAWKDAPVWGQVIGPIMAVLTMDTILLRLKNLVLQPFRRQSEPNDAAPRSTGARLLSLIGSLIATGILASLALLCLRHLGSIEEVKGTTVTPQFSPLKTAIDRYIPPAWTQRFDPLTSPERLTMARLLMMARGDAVPRAIPVPLQSLDDHAKPGSGLETWLDQLIHQGRTTELLRALPSRQSWHMPAWQDLFKKWGIKL